MFDFIFITVMAIATVVRSSSVPMTNLALEKPAFQTDTSYYGVPSRAVDGNTNSKWEGSSCTHTDSHVGPWWAVDLGQVYAIDHVTLYGRTDCCADRLSNVKLLIGTTNEDYVERGSFSGQLPHSYTFELTSPVNGRWVKIVRYSNVKDYFTLCEVQVFGNPTEVDPCDTAGVCNHGMCSSTGGDISCECDSGWTGTFCNTEEYDDESECAGIMCDECQHGYIAIEDGTCCGQCQCPKQCPKLTCKKKHQFQEEGMCCPECMCNHNGNSVKSGPVGDICDGCECVNGKITCNPVQCMDPNKLQCVDMVKGEDCCYTCPNGETCRHKNKVIVKGQIEEIKKEVCMCAPFWHPNAMCMKTKVKPSAFKGVDNYKGLVEKWFIALE